MSVRGCEGGPVGIRYLRYYKNKSPALRGDCRPAYTDPDSWYEDTIKFITFTEANGPIIRPREQPQIVPWPQNMMTVGADKHSRATACASKEL